MKEYFAPEIEIIIVALCDIITTSDGDDTPLVDFYDW